MKNRPIDVSIIFLGCSLGHHPCRVSNRPLQLPLSLTFHSIPATLRSLYLQLPFSSFPYPPLQVPLLQLPCHSVNLPPIKLPSTPFQLPHLPFQLPSPPFTALLLLSSCSFLVTYLHLPSHPLPFNSPPLPFSSLPYQNPSSSLPLPYNSPPI